MSWKLALLIAGAGWLFFLVYLAERADLRERRRTQRRQAWLRRFNSDHKLTDEQVRRHPAGHTPRKRYYR